MRVVFSPDANDDLDSFFAWIAKENPAVAYDMIARIAARVVRLSVPGFAEIGRAGHVESTRELVEPPYVIVYKISEKRNKIVIIAVFHTKQKRD